jgi:hypothetical protein
MTTSHAADRFKALPDDSTLAATVVALEEHRFSVDVVEGPRRCARRRSRIPEGSSVMTNTSVTLQETGSANAIDDGGPYDSARNKMMALDFPTQLQEMKAIAGESPSTATAVKRARRRARSTSRPVASPPAPGHGEDDVVDLRIPPGPRAGARGRLERLPGHLCEPARDRPPSPAPAAGRASRPARSRRRMRTA